MSQTIQARPSQAVAGPEMDAAIAEYVMGCKVIIAEWPTPIGTIYRYPECECKGRPHGRPEDGYGTQHGIRDYSTNIADAWQVVEKVMQLDSWVFRMNSHCGIANGYGVTFQLYNVPGSQRFAIAETAPLATCIAALKACGVEVIEPASQEVPA